MSSVLVTGGAGYIGAHIVDLLYDSGYDIVVFDNLSNGFKENVNPNVTFIKGDILNELDLKSIFENYKIDSIIHMASLKSVSESMSNPAMYSENNIIGSINLISIANQYNIKKFIFSSTAAVYGNPMYSPIDEKHSLTPINHYGFTKLYVENYINWISNFSDMKFICFRYFNAAGYSIKENLIKFRERRPENLFPIVMEVANGERDIMDVYGGDYDTPDGTCIRDYVHVEDLAIAHMNGLEYLNKNKNLTVNLSTSSGCSVLEVIKIAESVINKKINYRIAERRLGDPPILISKSNKAYDEIGWKANKSDIKNIIQSMWRIYNKKPL